MSQTHFEINKKEGWTIIGFLAMVIITMVGFGAKTHMQTNKEDKIKLELKSDRLFEAVGTNQQAIQQTMQKQAVSEEKMSGHEKNPVAHIK